MPSPLKSPASTSATRGKAGQLEHAVAAVFHPPEPCDPALLMVAGQERPEVGDQQVVAPVLVQVEHRRMRGVRDVGDDVQQPGRRIRGPSDHHVSVAHLGGDDLELAVAIDIGEAHVGDRRRLRRAFRRKRPPREDDLRRGVDGGPGLRRGQAPPARVRCRSPARAPCQAAAPPCGSACLAGQVGQGCPGERAPSWRSPHATPSAGGCREADSGGTRCRTV